MDDYHWESLAERADGLGDVRVLLLANAGIEFADRLPCDGGCGQQGQDEKSEDLNWETHVEGFAAGRLVVGEMRGTGRQEEINVLRCPSGLCLAHGACSLDLPLLDVKEMVLQRMNADLGGTWVLLILLLDFDKDKEFGELAGVR